MIVHIWRTESDQPPTVARFEEAIAALEGGEDAVPFGSGMAALTAVMLAVR